jgi:phosphoglucosamine mutase
MLAKSIFDALGAQTYVISNQPNGLNINNGCGSTHIEGLCDLVKKNGLDIGFAFDGDADRCLAVDEKGNILTGDHILYLCGCYMNNSGNLANSTVVSTVMSNIGLEKALEEKGIKSVKTDVGDKYVYEAMQKGNYNLGGEESGHMVLSDYSKTGDALMTGLVLAIGLKKSQSKMSQLFPLFTPMTCRRNDAKFKTTDEMKDAFENSAFKTAIQKGEQQINSKGKILIRKSGTEPKIQVWSWSDDVFLAEEINLNIISVLEQLNGFESIKKVQ